MNTSDFAFPKPCDLKNNPWVVKTYPSGRQVCNKLTAEGRREYNQRKLAMLVRQEGRCCLEAYAPMCPGSLLPSESTFDHEHGRGAGGGKRDDRIQLPDGTWINGACHELCNAWKGSRYIPYNQTFQKRGDDGRS